MKRKFIIALSLCSVLPLAQAVEYEDYARVVGVVPQMERFNNQHEECGTSYETVQTTQPHEERNIGGAVIGGVAGALLGNQVGKGTGRSVATAAGAITGAMVGDRVQNSNNNEYPSNNVMTEQRPVRRCRMVERWETREAGYRVTYEYKGHTFTEVMPFDPGRRLTVEVTVTPKF